MTFYTGTSGKDVLVGTSASDIFDMSQGGNDTVAGQDGYDEFRFGAELTAKDTIDGGGDVDTVKLEGDYSAGLKLGATTFTSIETLRFAAGYHYDLTLNEANFTANASIFADTLGSGDSLTFDAHKDTDTWFYIVSGAGDDTLIGGQMRNEFLLDNGGADTATGGDGPDSFDMGATFDGTDVLNGKGGIDQVSLTGDYSGGLTITKPMVKNIETVVAGGAFDYVLSADRHLLSAGDTISIGGGNMAAGHHFEFDGSAVSAGALDLFGSPGDDVLIGGDDADTFTDSLGGSDTFNGNKGDDTFRPFGTLDANDSFNGGPGYDTLELHGDYSAGVTMHRHTISNIEEITFFDLAQPYVLVTDDGNVGAGQTLNVDGLGMLSAITFNGIAETDGNFVMTGGQGDDVFTGGAGDDVLYGGGGGDRLNGYHGDDVLTGGPNPDIFNGGLGADTYVIGSVMDSTSTQYDRTLSFDANEDKFDLLVSVSAIAPTVHGGSLSSTTFDADLQAAIGAAELPAGEAVRFKPTSGDLAGQLFLIVDGDAFAGYHAYDDYVIRLDHHKHMGAFSIDNFI